MKIHNPEKIEKAFNQYFLKGYLLYCTIVSLVVLTFFFIKEYSLYELQNIQNFYLNHLGTFYFYSTLFAVLSLFYFRFFKPQWILSHVYKKLLIDLILCLFLIISYIPSTILVYAYTFSSFNELFLYGSYLMIILQIPNFFAGIIVSLLEGNYLAGFMIFCFAISRLITPIILFFSYISKNTQENEISTLNSNVVS